MTQETQDRLLEQAKAGDSVAVALMNEAGVVQWKLEAAQDSLTTYAQRIHRLTEQTLARMERGGNMVLEEIQGSASDYDAAIAEVRVLTERLAGLDRIIERKLEA